MRLSAFEKFLPWTGGLAGILWAGQMFIAKTPDDPADTKAVTVIGDAAVQNSIAGFALLAGALMLVFFAAAARTSLRSGEAGEPTYSSVAHGGFLVAAAGVGGLGIVQIALTNAAEVHDAAATATIGQLALVGWLPALVGLVAAFWGLGLGGLRTATLPKWFAITTVVLGVVGALGPAAMVVYLLLPLWLIAASLVTARRSRAREAQLAGA
ncbi:hypothetical protein [Microtetraspora malaysiensis]|uniref:hypothetical protein n=1 Tax=Microtetraspora malaysiensis TaxID=161358 RepID=UPI00082C73AF|nr:hypothetical protein [Microtetraspora malaysiensis]